MVFEDIKTILAFIHPTEAYQSEDSSFSSRIPVPLMEQPSPEGEARGF